MPHNTSTDMPEPIFEASQWSLVLGNDDASASSLPELELVRDGKFREVFQSLWIRRILGSDLADSMRDDVQTLRRTLDYTGFLERHLAARLFAVSDDDRAVHLMRMMCIGVAAMHAFVQSNITGPPLSFAPEKVLLPQALVGNSDLLAQLSKSSIPALSVDGETAYHLTPNSMLLALAKTIVNLPGFVDNENAPVTARWWRMRVNFLHQKVLSGPTATLHNLIYADMDSLLSIMSQRDPMSRAKFLIEKAKIDLYYGYDDKARKGLEKAASLTGLRFALTGVLGKRTRYQEKETSQLVVLAKSAADVEGASLSGAPKPQTLDLNDDTLLESISFTEKSSNETTAVKDESSLPRELASLDPGEQPPLHPLDATILLLLTDTIKNTNPETGITREEMLPYAERVLSHSTNWQVYTHALLVRSKIESYKSRTVERGVLQLQAVVDQVIAETTAPAASAEHESASEVTGQSTFLPRASESESAPVTDRLRYIHQLTSPTRWECEAELASKWAHLGGLRTALEIYERLEMWPEVALCWAATEREDKARELIRAQLFESDGSTERAPPPLDAPRLWCILGDLDETPACYERAWEVSGRKYARAQRSLGKHHLAKRDYKNAAAAYATSLKVNPLNAPGWFALGCCYLELEHYNGAVEAFGRVVGIDDDDAEAWSNLATALLRRETPANVAEGQHLRLDDEEEESQEQGGEPSLVLDKERNKKDALKALKRACQLKRDSWRIWENYLVVAAGLNPPSYNDVLIATKRIIDLRKDSAGETALDVEILEMLVQHAIASTETYDPTAPGLPKMVVELIEKDVAPLITTNPRLWKLVARLALWRKRPKAALEAEEKAWRTVLSRPGITDATEKEWSELVDATVELADAYESLGQMERTEGLAAGEMVAKDWRFKARSAVRAVMGRGKANWEGTSGWERLVGSLDGLKQQ